MPKDLLRRVNWDLMYPGAVKKFFDLAAACRARGYDYFAISGFRSDLEQDALYAQGRTAPGPVVTKARAWQSAHNFGVAVDWCLDSDQERRGLQPDWRLESYEVLAEEAERLGLEPALRWRRFREGPHVQLPLRSKGLSTHLLRQAYRRGGWPEVWLTLDERGPW